MSQQHKKEYNKKEPHIIVAGENDFNQIAVDPTNSFNLNKTTSININPPIKLPYENSPCLSYSVYNTHSVVVKNDGTAYAIGDNRQKQIIGNIPAIVKTWTQIRIKNKLNHDLPFISAVCGTEYTLYQLKNNNNHTLAYVYKGENDGRPLFLNTDDRTILGIFGGRANAAAIDENGCIVIITQSLFSSKDKAPRILSLPDNEKAIQVACLHKEYIVLSSKGNLYNLNLQNKQNLLVFQLITFQRNIAFQQVAGTWEHCLALSNDGKVFGMGKNQFGHLGIDKNKKGVENFIMIKNFDSYHVKGVFAGSFHSLVLCSDGHVLACGQNKKGELMIKNETNKNVTIPTQTILNGGVTFCVAGFKLSAAFVHCKPPPNIPNRVIDFSVVSTLPTPPPTKDENALIAELGLILTKFHEQYEQHNKKIAKIEEMTRKLANNLNICENKIKKFKQNMDKSQAKTKDAGSEGDENDNDEINENDDQFNEDIIYFDDENQEEEEEENNDNDNKSTIQKKKE